MSNYNIYINYFIKIHQKCLISISFSLLLLCLHSCVDPPDPDKDKYEIINLVLEEQIKSENISFILSDTNKQTHIDTLKFKKLVVDKFTRPKFVIDTSVKVNKIRICGLSNDHLKFNNYFDKKDLKYLKVYLNNDVSLELDRSKIIRNDLLIDYSSYFPSDTTSNTSNTLFIMWDKFHESDYNYSSISEPLINTSKDKALLGMSICVSDYILSRVFKLTKSKEGKWHVNSKMTFIEKLVDNTEATYIINAGTSYE